MQRLAFSKANDPKTSAAALAQLMRAWSELEERKRILRMKPKPKDIDVDPRNHRVRKPLRLAQIVDSAVDQVIDVPAVDVPVPAVPDEAPGQRGPGQPEPEPGQPEPEPKSSVT